MSLADPFSFPRSTKDKAVTFGFYVMYGKRVNYHRFSAAYAAKHFLNIVIAQDPFKWDVWAPAKGISDPMIRTSRGLLIRGGGIEEAMEYEFDKEEAAYVFPEPYVSMFPRIARDNSEPNTPTNSEPAEVGDDTGEPITRKTKATRPAREPAVPKPSKEGLVTIATIATDLKMEPRIARGILRDQKVPKPDVGWAWDNKDAKAIIKLLKENNK